MSIQANERANQQPARINSSTEVFKTDGGKTKSNRIEIPSISLPKGGGAIRGIDEKFSVNAVNGTSTFSIPLPFSTARNLTPNLSLDYNSGSGNGIFGMGWGVNLPSINRKTDKGLPQYNDAGESDVYIFSGAEDLVPEFKRDGNGSFLKDGDGNYIVHEKESANGLFEIRFYKPRIEGLFSRIERWTEKSTGFIKWRIISKENVTTLFGWSSSSVIADPKDARKIFEWLPEFVFDDKGNCCHYVYKREDEEGLDLRQLHNKNRVDLGIISYTNNYLHKIYYGNKKPYKGFGMAYPTEQDYFFRTLFDYGVVSSNPPEVVNTWDFRKDPFSSYKSGFEIRTTRLCSRVMLFHHFIELQGGDALVRTMDFEYSYSEGLAFLKSATSRGYIKKQDSSYSEKSLPAIDFEYQLHEWNREVHTIELGELVHSPYGVDGNVFRFTDLYNEGIEGILSEQANGWYYKQNQGDGKFSIAKQVAPLPSVAGSSGRWIIADLDADGGKQLVNMHSQTAGFFEMNEVGEWERFKGFSENLNIDNDDNRTRLIDLNGDGRADILMLDEQLVSWFPSEGRKGYSTLKRNLTDHDEEKGPRVVFDDHNQSIFLADMNGDGLVDIVRIRNGEICYWPNMGYGKFGAKITMDNAPIFDHPDSFDPGFLRMVDIDGTGTSDIVYLGKNKFSCWMNHSGNKFGNNPFEIDAFPEIDNGAMVSVADILGNGVPCIVWSSALDKDRNKPLKYLDLMKGKKPHLMTGYKNNMGKEVAFEYKPSTKYYLEDKVQGKPWITKLPFPVHCLSKTETRDKITGVRFVSSYKYHHGYFDQPEKEFRGFGMVEQLDSEVFDHWVKGDASNIVDESLHQTPVISKTWFHTGAFMGIEKILEQYEKEYWYAEMSRQGFATANNEHTLPEAKILASPELEDELRKLSVEEWKDAIRTCKGMMLRNEIFSDDRIEDTEIEAAIKTKFSPYTVSTQSFNIELIQPRGQNKYGIFKISGGEQLNYYYERNTEDPRRTHNLNLKTDVHGNVLESVVVTYPRMISDNSVPEEVKDIQSRTTIQYTVNAYTNDVNEDDVYRLRLPCDVQTYELKNVETTGNYFGATDFGNIMSIAEQLEFENTDMISATVGPKMRLIERTVTKYRSNNLKYELPLHEIESLALPYESFQLAFSPALVNEIYNGRVDDQMMDDAKYVHMDNDSNWWIRSGRMEYLNSGEQIDAAKDRFYSPLLYEDPCGYKTRVGYYSDYFLFTEWVVDAMENKTVVDAFDFRVMSPKRMRDVNNNISEIITDELGMVKATAIYGKGAEADNMENIEEHTDENESLQIQKFLHVESTSIGVTDSDFMKSLAKQLLNKASTRFVYDFHSYLTNGRPVVIASILREEHYSKNPDSAVQISFEYANGFGEIAMKKMQAEPGRAKIVKVNDIDNTIEISETDTGTLLRWVSSGRIVKNNKGNAVKQYEPYFSVNHEYDSVKELVENGVTALMYYDAPGRLVATELPDGNILKFKFGPWTTTNYDENDNVITTNWYNSRINNSIDAILIAEGKDPLKERTAAEKSANYFNTPTVIHIDSQGRAFCVVTNNRMINTATALWEDHFFITINYLDIEGNMLAIRDACNMIVVKHKYNMLGIMSYLDSMDSGERWLLHNNAGHAIQIWDAKGQKFINEYDSEQRLITVSLIKNQTKSVIERNEYLDTKNLSPTDIIEGQKLNQINRLIGKKDTAGISKMLEYDFKGNLLESSRQFCKVYKSHPDWSDGVIVDLDDRIFQTEVEFDALNRPLKTFTAYNESMPSSIMEPMYNAAGLLDSLRVVIRGSNQSVNFIDNIQYNAKGQRTAIYYSNNTVIKYKYDIKSSRLTRLLTTGNNGSKIFQDLSYTYDAVGNITHIYDKANKPFYFNGEQMDSLMEFEYDALYQLIKAEGREHSGQNNLNENGNNNSYLNFPFQFGINPNDVNAVRNYKETYLYDPVGNIKEVKHTAVNGSWTRKYWYNNNDQDRAETAISGKKNNWLLQTKTGGNTNKYVYDVHGNMKNQPHLSNLSWDFIDQLQEVNLGGGGRAFYIYDSLGNRIRKIIERNTGESEERLYLGAVEVFTKKDFSNNTIRQIDTLNLSDDLCRFGIIDIPVIGNAGQETVTSFIYNNHIGSATLELNEFAEMISYEEYHPFGTTSYHQSNPAVRSAAKRYKYAAMERDEESGLCHHGARYYLPWLGRWLSADPSGLEGGINQYKYSFNNPICYVDVNGREPTKMVPDAATKEQYRELRVIYTYLFLLNKHANKEHIIAAVKRADALKIMKKYGFEDDLILTRHQRTKESFGSAFLKYEKDFIDQYGNDAAYQLGGPDYVVRMKPRTAEDEAASLEYARQKEVEAQRYLQYQAVLSSPIFAGASMSIAKLITKDEAKITAVGNIGAGVGNLVEAGAQTYTKYAAAAKQRTNSNTKPVKKNDNPAPPEIVRLDKNGLPQQLGGTMVGPAYKTYEEASRSGSHVVEVIVRYKGKQVASWWEASEKGVSYAGHTEQKVLTRVALIPGVRIEMRGEHPPCPYSGGCMNTMRAMADLFGVEIVYRKRDGAVYPFMPGVE